MTHVMRKPAFGDVRPGRTQTGLLARLGRLTIATIGIIILSKEQISKDSDTCHCWLHNYGKNSLFFSCLSLFMFKVNRCFVEISMGQHLYLSDILRQTHI